ncbi:MAG: Type 1 glutamine amidotransferase-like domain-containing protein, partial [Bacteroidetes bacterium]|nr:Type 1 glutamine amidotransferase-like domain-containing protein [Bacteroidota bacterium]
MRHLIIAGLCLIFLSCNSQTETAISKKISYRSSGPQKGSLILGGGNISDPSIFGRFMELAGGPEALIILIPTAMEDQHMDTVRFRTYYESMGAKNLMILHTRDVNESNERSFYSIINDAGGVWFYGGRQWRLADSYLNTKVHDALNDLLKRGGVIGGSS